ncbi:phage holin family protein [Sphingobium lignivorans]|uniref:Membrane protein YqjE n=1 Tax=Sphingobium lignivorans TaxID=2735886 RepID=A0ABR6NI63_9SPHN|nr:phage holin family protein [Sphingobium lignivorans]MBB5986317.1 putative membrane protein YqjE [Sphingobium lignivorans]
MTTPDGETEAQAAPTADDGSIRASVERLVASGREMAEAELTWAKLKAAIIGAILGRALAFGVLAFVFLVMTLIMLIVAAVIALAPMVGWLGATLIVAGVSLAATILFGLLTRSSVQALKREGKP